MTHPDITQQLATLSNKFLAIKELIPVTNYHFEPAEQFRLITHELEMLRCTLADIIKDDNGDLPVARHTALVLIGLADLTSRLYWKTIEQENEIKVLYDN